jgi:hypothetical protein
MARDRQVSDRDGLLVARISGIARRHARWGQLTEPQKTAGAAELREVAGGRCDLLAEEAGVALGTSRDKGPEYRAQAEAIAELCRLAGADESLIPEWIEKAGAGPRLRGCLRSASPGDRRAGDCRQIVAAATAARPGVRVIFLCRSTNRLRG